MIRTGFRHWWIVGLFACLPFAACDDSAPEKGAGEKSATVPAKKRSAAGDNMVAAVPAGKAATVVGVYFTLGTVPVIGVALPVDVAIVPHQDFTGLQARFYTQGDGLTLVSGDILNPVSNAKSEVAMEHKLVLMPNKEGVYMVTVNLETQDTDGSVSRIFSIPVIVAPPGGAAAQAPAEAPPAPATN